MVNTVTLDKIKVGAQARISKHLLDARVDIIERTFDQLEVNLIGYVWGQQNAVQQKVVYPTDWLEAFKERWFPKWLLDRYPVKYTVVNITADVIYPNLKVKLPREQHSLTIALETFETIEKFEDRYLFRPSP